MVFAVERRSSISAVTPLPSRPNKQKHLASALLALERKNETPISTPINQARVRRERPHQMNGNLWAHQGYTANKIKLGGGWIHYFEPCVSDVEQAEATNDELFPAIEMQPISNITHITALAPDADDDAENPNYLIKFRAFFEILGYSFVPKVHISDLHFFKSRTPSSCNYYLTHPDDIALQGRWDAFQKEHPNYPKLKIDACPGIATDKMFIGKYTFCDILISNRVDSGKVEFAHDSQTHAMARITMILENAEAYKALRPIEKGICEAFVEIIELLEKPTHTDKEKELSPLLIAVMSSFIDVSTAIILTDRWKYHLERGLGDLIQNYLSDLIEESSLWEKYFKKQFPSICPESQPMFHLLDPLNELWQKVSTASPKWQTIKTINPHKAVSNRAP